MKNTIHYSAFTVRSQRGSALIITLLIVTILISLAVEFAYEVYIDSSALSNWSNAQKASLTAKSGQTLGAAFVRNIPDTNTYSEILLPVEKDFGPDTLLTVKIEDENAKFNVNSVGESTLLFSNNALLSLQNLFKYLKINQSLASAIADWIDSDHVPRPGLKDSEFNAKNLPLWSIEELKLIEGIDDKTFEKIRPFLTVHSEKRINVNTAPLPVLLSMHKDMTEAFAQSIIDYRESLPFQSREQLQYVLGTGKIWMELPSNIDFKSSIFRVSSTATVNGITRVIESVVDKNAKVLYWREG